MAEQIITIYNNLLEVKISSKGAELKSIKSCGNEKLWQGDPAFWTGQAPIMFPICGGLKDDKYVFEGKGYNLQKHGYIRFAEFEIESAEKDKAVFLHCSNEETIKQFPFIYEFRVIYTLEENSLNVEYSIKNLSGKEMYFSVGAHEAYSCPEGIEKYSVIFEETENLDSNILNGNLLEYETVNVGKNTTELPLKYEYFSVDALVFLNLKSRKVQLKNRITSEVVTLEFNGNDAFLLWTKPGAKYICMEPWSGMQDFIDSNYDITTKRGIIKLPANDACSKKHKITF